jgi:hypothetical protein
MGAEGRISPGEGAWSRLPVNDSTGFDGTIAANTTEDITITPPKDFTPYYFVVDERNIHNFLIDSIKVEGDELLATSGSIPAANFGRSSSWCGLPRRTCRGGRNIVLRVRNRAAVAKNFVAEFIGVEDD